MTGIFIPAYQAESTLHALFERIPEEVWEKADYVVVIDDGSKDGTSNVVRQWQSRQKKMHLETFPRNQGYGAAVRRGLALCRERGCQEAVCLHADGQYPPECIPEALDKLRSQGLDLLQGSRHLQDTALKGGMPLYKYVAGKVLTRMENFCFGLSMTDYHSGFLVYGPRALERLPFEKLSGYFDFDLEAIATATAKGLRVGEMAIPTRYAGETSYLNPWRYGMKTLAVMSRYLRGHYGRL